MHKKQGHFIVVEGLEGAGKSTALNFIKRFLIEKKIDIISTREPGGTHVGEIVRQLIKEMPEDEELDARAELLLFYAARVQLLEKVIKPALQKGQWVLADRFELSSFAYQGGGRKLDMNVISQLSNFCLQGLQPDLTIFLDIEVQNGLHRVKKRGKIDRIEQEPPAFFDDVAHTYREKISSLDNVITIDANQPLPLVQNALRQALENYVSQQVYAPEN